jgi:enoyl-CoA hydratase/carnithine racemase
MKTTVELPEKLYKNAKALAKRKKKTLRELLIDALKKIVAEADEVTMQPEWMHCVGKFSGSKNETEAIQEIINADLGQVNESEWK